MRFQCPECREAVAVPDPARGQRASCPECRTPFLLPEPRILAAPLWPLLVSIAGGLSLLVAGIFFGVSLASVPAKPALVAEKPKEKPPEEKKIPEVKKPPEEKPPLPPKEKEDRATYSAERVPLAGEEIETFAAETLLKAKATKAEVEAASVLPCLFWEADGSHLLLAQADGVVRRIEFPALVSVAEARFGEKVSWLTPSAEGLLVSLPESGEVRLLDPATLKTRKRIEVPDLSSAVSALPLSTGFAILNKGVSRLDLKAGKAEEPQANAFGATKPGLLFSPDGELLLVGSAGALSGWRKEGDTYRQPAKIISRVQPGISPAFSPDGTKLFVPKGFGGALTGRAFIADAADPATKGTRLRYVEGCAAVGDDGLVLGAAGSDYVLAFVGETSKPGFNPDAGAIRQILIHEVSGHAVVLGQKAMRVVHDILAPIRAADALPPIGSKPPKEKLPKEKLPKKGKGTPGEHLVVQRVEPKGAGRIRSLCWVPGTTQYLALGDNADLFRIDFRTGEVQKKELEAKASHLCFCAEGLMVTVADAGEMRILDPDTFALRTKAKLPGVVQVVASPTGSTAVALFNTGELALVNTKTGKPVKAYTLAELPRYSRFKSLALSGSALFVSDGEQMHRFRLTAKTLKLEQTSQRFATSENSPLCLAPDGSMVCRPSPAGNRKSLPNHPPLGVHSTYVYAAKDLSKPVCTLASGAYPRAVAFDPKLSFIYAQGKDEAVQVYTSGGVKKKGFSFSDRDVEQLLAHPEGGKLVVLFEGGKLLHLDTSKALSEPKSE